MKAKRITRLALMICIALVLSYVERFFIIPIPIVGIKLGLANLAVIVSLYLYNEADACIVSVMRVFLAVFLLGNVSGFLFSLGGAILSLAVMCLAKRVDFFSLTGTSILGAIFHNIGQILVCAVITQTMGVLFYLPVLIIAGAVCGLLNGTVANMLVKALSKQMQS